MVCGRERDILIFLIEKQNVISYVGISFSFSGKNLELGLRKEGVLAFVRELNGNDEDTYENYLRDASMYARGNIKF